MRKKQRNKSPKSMQIKDRGYPNLILGSDFLCVLFINYSRGIEEAVGKYS